MSVIETAVKGIIQLGQNTKEEERDEVEELHYVDRGERVLRVFQRILQTTTKATLALTVGSVIAFEPIATSLVDAKTCPFGGAAIAFPVISLVSGTFWLFSIGLSGMVSTCISQRALRRQTAEEQLNLDTQVHVIHRTKSFFGYAGIQKVLDHSKKPEIEDDNSLGASYNAENFNLETDLENGFGIMQELNNITSNSNTPNFTTTSLDMNLNTPKLKLKKIIPNPDIKRPAKSLKLDQPSLCERTCIIAEQAFTLLSKITGGMAVLGIAAMQLHQKRFEICEIGSGIIPVSLSFVGVAGVSAALYGIGSLFSSTANCLKTTRVNTAVSRKND